MTKIDPKKLQEAFTEGFSESRQTQSLVEELVRVEDVPAEAYVEIWNPAEEGWMEIQRISSDGLKDGWVMLQVGVLGNSRLTYQHDDVVRIRHREHHS